MPTHRSFAVVVLCTLLVALTTAPAQQGQSQQKQPHGFAPSVSYNSGGRGPDAIAIADLNGDGKLDLAVANLYDNSVGVLLGNGDGTFQPAVSYGTSGLNPLSIAIRDLNGDGHPDLVVTSQFSYSNPDGAVSVLLGNGDGTFRAPASYDSGGSNPFSVAVADLNGDGIPDLAVANECAGSGCGPDGGVSVLLGNGDGTFQSPVNYDSGAFSARSVAIGDVNGDGIPDLVVANQATCSTCSTSSIGVLLGNGDGTFKAASIYDSGPAESFSVAIGDLNGDGYPDLAVSTECSGGPTCVEGGVNVLMGNGNGTFQSPIPYGSGSEGPDAVVMADVNGDGYLDLIVAECSCSIGTLGVLPGNGDGTFQAAIVYQTGGSYSLSVAVADLNSDGKADVVLASGTVRVLLNNTAPAKTALAVASSPNPSLVNQSVTFTATIGSIVRVPNGSTVTFYHGKTALGTGRTTRGVATLTTSFARANTYVIQAKYAGDAFHKASSGAVKQVVNH